MIDRENLCLWCGTLTAQAMTPAERRSYVGDVCPDCDGPKGRWRKRCRDCAEAARGLNSKRDRQRGDHGYFATEDLPDRSVCPTCGGIKSLGARNCRPCFNRRAKGRRKALTGAHKITPGNLDMVHELYETAGMPMHEALEHVDHRYATPTSALSSMYSIFGARGWPLRSKSEAKYVAIARAEWLGGHSPLDNLANRRVAVPASS